MQKSLYNKTILGVLLIAASPYAARAEHAAERLNDAATVFEEIMSGGTRASRKTFWTKRTAW